MEHLRTVITIELTGKLIDCNIDFVSGQPKLTLAVNEKNALLQGYDDLKDKDLSIKITQFRKKRSLNANNYAWKLITEIGNNQRLSKEEVYLNMLRDYGQSDMISVIADVPIGNYVKYYDEAGESTLNGKLFKHYKVYKGSSEFDTLEMSIFIDGIVQEAKALGIQTETSDEIARMKAIWDENN